MGTQLRFTSPNYPNSHESWREGDSAIWTIFYVTLWAYRPSLSLYPFSSVWGIFCLFVFIFCFTLSFSHSLSTFYFSRSLLIFLLIG